MATPSAIRLVGPYVRAALKLTVAAGFVYWLYAFIVYNDDTLQEKHFQFVDDWQVPYKWGNDPDAYRIEGEVVFWVVITWSVLLGGAILTTLAERIRTDNKHHRIWRLQARANYVLDFQLFPRVMWSRVTDGMSVWDALVICLFLFFVLWSTLKGYFVRDQRISGVLAVGIPPYMSPAKFRLSYIAHELGTALMGPAWLLFVTVPHGSFVQTLTGLDYHSMIRYHRWFGNMMLIQTTLHGWLYYAYWWSTSQWYEEFRSWNTTSSIGNVQGFIAWLCGVVIFVTSIGVVRRRFFEVFYRFHVVAFVGFVVFGSLHAQEFFFFVTPGLVLFGVDLVFRALAYASVTTPSRARLNAAGDVGELTFEAPRASAGCPMRRIYLALDSHSRWEWHPFSVAGRASDGRLTVAIKRYGAFTSAILDAVRERRHLDLRAYVPREHAGYDARRHEDTALVVAGGIGVTAALALLDELVLERTREAAQAGEGDQGGDGKRGREDVARAAVDEAGSLGHGAAGPPPSAPHADPAPSRPSVSSTLPRRVVFVWVARNVHEFFVIRPRILAAATHPSGWLELRLHCTGRLPHVSSAFSLCPDDDVVPGVPATLRGGEGIPGIDRRSIGTDRGQRRAGTKSSIFRGSLPGNAAGDGDGVATEGGAATFAGRAGAGAGIDVTKKGGPRSLRDGKDGLDGSESGDDDLRRKTSSGAASRSGSSLSHGREDISCVGDGDFAKPATAVAQPPWLTPRRASFDALPDVDPRRAGPPATRFVSPFFWRAPRRLSLGSHDDVVWILVHVLAFFGAFAGIALSGAYVGEYIARADSIGLSPSKNEYMWRTNGLALLGLVIGGLGLPFALVAFPYGLITYLLDVKAAARAEAAAGPVACAISGVGDAGGRPGEAAVDDVFSRTAPGPAPSPPADDALPMPYELERADPRPETRVTTRQVTIAGTDLGADVLAGRPDVAGLIADAASSAGRGGIVGVYVSGPELLNKSVHDAVGRANHTNKGVLFVHHKITGML